MKRQQQAQVGEVVDIMHANMEKLFEEDQKLCELERHAKDLKVSASVSFRIVHWSPHVRTILVRTNLDVRTKIRGSNKSQMRVCYSTGLG